MLWEHEAVGSNPAIPILVIAISILPLFMALAPSSSGKDMRFSSSKQGFDYPRRELKLFSFGGGCTSQCELCEERKRLCINSS